MAEQTSESEPEGENAERLYQQSLLLLSSVRDTLAAELARTVAGDAKSLKDLTTKQSELELALRRAFETEQKFHDWNAKRAADHTGAEIDFDNVRHEIGCRLARLRSCCDSD